MPKRKTSPPSPAPAGQKWCPGFGTYKAWHLLAVSFFTKDSTKDDGLRTRCVECISKANLEARTKKKIKTEAERQMPDDIKNNLKWCYRCKAYHTKDKFGKDAAAADGLRNACREQANKHAKKPNESIRKRKRKYLDTQRAGECADCGQESKQLNFCYFNKADRPERQDGKAIKSIVVLTLGQIQELVDTKVGRFICQPCLNKDAAKHQIQPAEIQTDQAKYSAKKREETRDFVNAKKLETGKCTDCPKSVTVETLQSFEWDHIDVETKIDSIANMVSQHRSVVLIEAEMAKCELVCHECHIARTKAQWKRGDLKAKSDESEVETAHKKRKCESELKNV